MARAANRRNMITLGWAVAWCSLIGCTRSSSETRDLPPRPGIEDPELSTRIEKLKSLGADVTVDLDQVGRSWTAVDLAMVSDVAAAIRLTVQLPNLRRLNLQGSAVDIEDLALLSNATALRWLDLSDTPIEDEDLGFLDSASDLEFLLLWGTRISNPGLERISHLKRLHKLDVSGTRISDEGLDFLGALPHLQELCIEVPGLSEESVAKLQGRLPYTLITH